MSDVLVFMVFITLLVGLFWREEWINPIYPFAERPRDDWLVIVVYVSFVLLLCLDVMVFVILGRLRLIWALISTAGILGFGAAFPEIGNFVLHGAREIVSGGAKAITSSITTFFVSICIIFFLLGIVLGIQSFVQAALSLAIIVGVIYLFIFPFLPKKKDKK